MAALILKLTRKKIWVCSSKFCGLRARATRQRPG
uniref:Uncharacterized protein n=1 Tax=Erwinia amylovora ATCC BAA-2158 TaxID=889211 RepID=E5B3V5_ERWAM|nr:hypothetical protein predicted by Glimmer/Critica [Erwinia amylovora ATCC BAA-2158]